MTIVWQCDRTQVDATVANGIDAFCVSDAAAWQAYSGARSAATQMTLYAEGRAQQADGTWVVTDPDAIVTDALPADDPHCQTPALAVDLCILVNGEQTWTYADPAWARLLAYVRGSPHLHSGADFPGAFKDPDHVERVNWRAFVQPRHPL
jgi:hypothetical protein